MIDAQQNEAYNETLEINDDEIAMALGFHAYEDDYSLSDNPYDACEVQWNLWYDGYIMAEANYLKGS